MGRLTLNMLLSFAQFEREVTAERIRDKIAASKARGMWMGGTPPLGYEPDGRTLHAVEAHADLVRTVFRRYLDLGNVRLLEQALIRDGMLTPRQRRVTSGLSIGGRPFSRGQNSMACCVTLSTLARSCMGTRSIRACIKPLSSATCGIGYRPLLPPTSRAFATEPARRGQACSPAGSSTGTGGR
jgi:hypothetical protein